MLLVKYIYQLGEKGDKGERGPEGVGMEGPMGLRGLPGKTKQCSSVFKLKPHLSQMLVLNISIPLSS